MTESEGSPPHAWGIRDRAAIDRIWNWFTPTCVGNTDSEAAHGEPLGVHPHMRGEYGAMPANQAATPGSPPHAWGILPPGTWRRSRFRFTPTCVGNTSAGLKTGMMPSVHPRACGEYIAGAMGVNPDSGSPPHMRGTPGPCRRYGIRGDQRRTATGHRFTPAHAGNTATGDLGFLQATVHPRTCGEHLVPARWGWWGYGSPPRMRGTQRLEPLHPFPRRFTPRACGEHGLLLNRGQGFGGSPPRMRGTLSPFSRW